MFKKIGQLLLFSCLLTVAISAQKLEKPSLQPSPATPAQKQLIDEGVKLHDAGKYDEAIEKYAQVLKENPDCDQAIYELAFSAQTKQDHAKALEYGYRLIKYKSNLGSADYAIIGNSLDDTGKSKEAVDFYRAALKMLNDDKTAGIPKALIGYNLGISYSRLGKFVEAREAMKNAAIANFSFASPHLALAKLFRAGKYKIPSLLAACRFVTLEQATPRAKEAVSIIREILKSPAKDEKTNSINIFMDMNAPKDEGDFGFMDLVLGTVMIIKDDKDKNKTEAEVFSDAIDTTIGILSEQKKQGSTFVGKTYIPFMAAMKEKGMNPVFSNLVLYIEGSAEAKTWLTANRDKLQALLTWSSSYQLGN